MNEKLLIVLVFSISMSIIGVVSAYIILKHKQTRKIIKRIIKFTYKG